MSKCVVQYQSIIGQSQHCLPVFRSITGMRIFWNFSFLETSYSSIILSFLIEFNWIKELKHLIVRYHSYSVGYATYCLCPDLTALTRENTDLMPVGWYLKITLHFASLCICNLDVRKPSWICFWSHIKMWTNCPRGQSEEVFSAVDADCGSKVDINSGKRCQSFRTMLKLWKIMDFIIYLIICNILSRQYVTLKSFFVLVTRWRCRAI